MKRLKSDFTVLDDEREEPETSISDPPSLDPSMSVPFPFREDGCSLVMTFRFTSSAFDDILASFSQGEWAVPINYFTAE